MVRIKTTCRQDCTSLEEARVGSVRVIGGGSTLQTRSDQTITDQSARACKRRTRSYKSLRIATYRLTHDALYNLHELTYDLGDFVKVVTTYPDIIVVCGLDKLVQEVKQILKVDSEHAQLLSYDTTFQLGDFYVSPLLYRHVLFTKSPVIPALFLIHERKFQGVHECFMHHVAQLVPSLAKGKKKVPLVTDEEVGINQVRL